MSNDLTAHRNVCSEGTVGSTPKRFLSLALLWTVASLSGCASINKALQEAAAKNAARRAAAKAPVQVQWRQPRFSAVPQSAARRPAGDLSVVATPVVYQKQMSETYSDTEIGRNTEGSVLYCRKYVPIARVGPPQMGFTLTIVNQLARVFRSAGSVISLNINGQDVAFDQSGIREFLDVMVLPGGRTQVTVWGPPLESLPDTGTIGLLLYDVVLAVDAAGNTTKKQNYDWFFTYSLETVSETEPVRFETVAVDRPGERPVPRSVPGAHCPP
jgi:hypothetical protein